MKTISFHSGKHGYLVQYLIRQSSKGYCCESDLKLCLQSLLNLSINSILVKLLCRFMNFKEMEEKLKKLFLKKGNEKL